MAGKSYGGQLVYNGATPGQQSGNPRLVKAFAEGYAGGSNPYSSSATGADFAAYTAFQNGLAVAGTNPPTGEVAGRRWETV